MGETSVHVIKSSKPSTSEVNCVGVNTTYKETHNGFMSIFKPKKGEVMSMKRTIKGAPLYMREILAYELDKLFEFNLVPPTVRASGKKGVGSRQLWVEGDSGCDFSRIKGRGITAQKAKLVFFDIVAGNCDRHGANLMFDSKNKRIWAIDHGFCFPTVMEQFRVDHLGSLDISYIKSGKYDEVRENWISKIPVAKIEKLRKITKDDFLSLFKKYKMEKEGKSAWNRFKKLLVIKRGKKS